MKFRENSEQHLKKQRYDQYLKNQDIKVRDGFVADIAHMLAVQRVKTCW